MTKNIVLAALVAAAVPGAALAQDAPPRIHAHEIDGHLRFLSHDLLEGRAPATRGGALTEEYLATQLMIAGLGPGVDGSYFQPVPIDVVTADPASIRVEASGRATRTLRQPDDVVVWAGSAAERSRAHGELVFAGYGADAPEFRWDDFKGMDLTGKVLMVLVNDPPATRAEPDLFGGRAMTYYGRWTYKFEEAERRGAAGMLIVHTTEDAGYPWQTVVGSWGKEQRMLPRDPALPAPLGFRGWITDEAAAALLREAGLDLARLRRDAATRRFRPVATGITVDVGFDNTVERLSSSNVVGVVRGADPALRDQHVVFTAHWDHLGIGPAVNGDSIYNGALDNASGVSSLLAVARAAAQGPRPRRSLLFVFVTAEESGLLGSEFYARGPTVPAASLVAAINVDGGNLLGRTRDFQAMGEDKSTLGPLFQRMIAPLGYRTSPDPHPERGYFYRSDHFSFAKAGIPAIWFGAGVDYEGRPEGWGVEQVNAYTAAHYHQPSDEYRPDFDLSGAVQLAEIVLDFGLLLASTGEWPAWNPDAEFRRPDAASAAR
jgi:Zn-dependent M28 family amino/carboxypeptidase